MEILQQLIHPQIREIMSHCHDEFESPVTFQQDGAPPGILKVCEILAGSGIPQYVD